MKRKDTSQFRILLHCPSWYNGFCSDDDPVTERVGVGAVLPENSDGNDASKAGKENDTLPSSHAPESGGVLICCVWSLNCLATEAIWREWNVHSWQFYRS